MSVLGAYVLMLAYGSSVGIRRCSSELKRAQVPAALNAREASPEKGLCPNAPLRAQFGEKIREDWNERDLAVLLRNTIHFLFWLRGTGPGKEGVGWCWHPRNRTGAVWAGVGWETRTLILPM